MSLVQGSLAKMEDILMSEGKWDPQPEHLQPRYRESRSATSTQVKDKIVKLVVDALAEQKRIDQGKQMDMAPFTLYNSANLAEEWTQLESNTIFSILCTFGICGLYSGQFDVAFSTKAFIEALQNDIELRERMGTIGKSRLDLSENLVSSFVFFNRRMTISTATSSAHKRLKNVMEVTGAPMFLTCALVIDACKLFLEGAAFVLITYAMIQNNYDARLLSMVQAAQRLEEFDGNQYDQEDVDQDRQSKEAEPCQPSSMSICQVSAKFIKEMVETMHKWKLAASIYRKPRHPTETDSGKPGGSSEPTQSRDVASASSTTTSCGPPDNSTNSSGAREAVARGLEPRVGYDHNNLLSAPGNPAMYTIASTEHVTSGAGPHVIPHAHTTGWPNYMHPVVTETAPPTGHLQGHYVLPTQFWPLDVESFRMYGSAENLMPGTFADPNVSAGDNGGTYESQFFNSFFDSFLPH